MTSLMISGCSCFTKNTPKDHATSSKSMYDESLAHGKYNSPEEYIEKGSNEDFIMTAGNRILFPFDSFSITEEEKNILDKQIAWLKEYDEYDIVLEGHCDERGTREYNIALGEKRANTIKKYMTKNGINEKRIKEVISYGKDKPLVEGSNEEAWRLNRRG
uniref:OmpA-like domain-containing protein n=1 Tax=Biomphalaria glabrata TaxID=6526 RepID=A0A2C9KHL8_BIOGL